MLYRVQQVFQPGFSRVSCVKFWNNPGAFAWSRTHTILRPSDRLQHTWFCDHYLISSHISQLHFICLLPQRRYVPTTDDFPQVRHICQFIRYKLDTCAPAYLTVGDGGNVEGLYRNFVDEVNPNTGKTYCEAADPNSMAKDGYGPWYQRQVQPSGCTTISFQDRDVYSDASPTPEGLVVNDNDPSKFWYIKLATHWL